MVAQTERKTDRRTCELMDGRQVFGGTDGETDKRTKEWTNVSMNVRDVGLTDALTDVMTDK